jgi:beta-phosphoglucomutase-like phosphatase (HAD superfamily)
MVQAVISTLTGQSLIRWIFHIQAWKRAFEKFGKEISYELIRPQIGKGADDMLPMFFSKNELHRFGRELEQYRGKLFEREYLPKVKAFPRVRDLFERIKQEGKKISLASTAKEKRLISIKKSLGSMISLTARFAPKRLKKPNRTEIFALRHFINWAMWLRIK